MADDDPGVEGIGGAPDEADVPPTVGADAVPACTVALERLEPMAGREAEVGGGIGRTGDDELPKRDASKAGREATRTATLKGRVRFGVVEGAALARQEWRKALLRVGSFR